MEVNLVNQTYQNADHSPESEINAYDGARPKRPIRGQQYHSQSSRGQQHHSQTSDAPTPSSYDQNKAIANIQRQVDGLAKQFTQLMARETRRPPPPAPRGNKPAYSNSQGPKPSLYNNPLEYTMDGRPICAYCKNPGHLKRDCRKKAAADLRRPLGNQ